MCCEVEVFWLSGRWLFLAGEGLIREAWLEEGHSVEKQRYQRYLCDSLSIYFFMGVCSFLIMVQNILCSIPWILITGRKMLTKLFGLQKEKLVVYLYSTFFSKLHDLILRFHLDVKPLIHRFCKMLAVTC